MLTAKDIMTRDVITVSPDTDIAGAAKLLLDNHINGLPVINDKGLLLGIICQSDLISQQKKLSIPSFFTFLDGYIALTAGKHLEKEFKKIAAVRVEDAMTSNPATLNSDTQIDEVASLMVEKNFHSLPVIDNGKLVGIIGKEDILKTIMNGSGAS